MSATFRRAADHSIEIRQLDLQDRGLDRVEPEVAADDVMEIARLHPVLAKNSEALRQLVVIAHDRCRRLRPRQDFSTDKS